MSEKAEWVLLLETWRDDGTRERLDNAVRDRTPVQIKRSSGEFVEGILVSASGHAGLTCTVAWGEDLDGVRVDVGADRVRLPEGVFGKHVDTKDLLEWNPQLRGASA